MKLTKIAALGLSLVLMSGACGCSSKSAGNETETTPGLTRGGIVVSEREPAVTGESSISESTAASYADKPTADASDTEGGKVVIWSYNSDFKKILEKYSPVKDYEYVEIPAGSYKARLEEAFDSDQAPDIFICGYDDVKEYADSDKTAPINAIGISNKSCSDMYDYTLRLGSDSNGNIKGLAWELAPAAVYYKKSLAAQYLGSSDIDQVAKNFSSWNAFLSAARLVNKESDGSVKIVAGTDEMFKSYIGGKTAPWITDGKLSVDPQAETYFNYAKIFSNEKLTFGASYGSDEWKAGMRNKTVVSYWGPLSLSRSQEFALDTSRVSKVNHTSGDWGIVAAPGAFAWGGSWIMVSSKSDMKKSCADIITAICCDQANLKEILDGGLSDFVNSKSVINAAAADERYKFAWLDNQNPYLILAAEAERINANAAGPGDDRINEAFYSVANVFATDKIKSVKDAKAMFREILIEKKIVKE